MTKLGQNPSRQEKSWLQLDWSIRRLRPKGVSMGSTAMQLDFTEQSPQSSQTRGLIMTRLVAFSARPRLRLRRRSVAHSWS
ncbi:MAG: hypothetical protein EBY30_15305 [Rhodospirillales bacterium]|nr:hypothetical protein [Rhodospirillales bacterium]